MNKTKKMVIAALCVAIGVALPMAFHSIPNAGSIFLPMHIPVLLCGLICGPVFGLICGILTPFISSLATGMPPMAILPSMLCELAVYGLATGFLMSKIKTGKMAADIYVSLVCSMLLGRLTYGVLNALIFKAGAYSIELWLAAAFTKAIPGIAIQLVIIPIIVLGLERARLIDRKY